MPFTVTFTATAFVAGSLRTSGNTLLVDDPTARMLVDLGVATAPGLTAQTGAVAPNLARTDGATFTGKLNTLASSTSTAGLNVPHGAAPTPTPVNGDVWSTTSGLFVRINGSSQQVGLQGQTTTWTSGHTFTAPSLSLGTSTAASTYNLGTGATVSGSTKAVNIGTGALAGATTSISIGSTTGTSTTTINGTLNAPGLANGVKAWVNFNGQGVVAIRASNNVTSLTDNAVGDYTINFTTAMADANYAVVGSGTEAADRTNIDVGLYAATTNYVPSTKTTSAARISVTRGANVATDVGDVSVIILR